MIPFCGGRHILASDLLLLHHLGHLLAVPFLPDEYLSYGVIQLFKILPKLLAYFFIEFPDYIFQSSISALELFSATVLPNSSIERVSASRRLLLSLWASSAVRLSLSMRSLLS